MLFRSPQAAQTEPNPVAPGTVPGGGRTGLGWLLSPDSEVAIIAGGGHDATAFLAVRIRDGRTYVVLTSRMIPVNTIAERLLRT